MDNSYLDNVESCITTVFIKAILDTLNTDSSKKVLENVLQNIETFKDYLTKTCTENIKKTIQTMLTLKSLENIREIKEC